MTLRNIVSAHEARNQIAQALNLDSKAAESDAALAAALRDRHSLIVLDDLDALLTHDRSGAAELLTALLGARRLTLITTARRDLPGKVHHQPLELARLDPHDAQIAFTIYAPPIDAWGEWTPDDWFDLHRFLDGYPFPIRLAATAMKQARLGLRDLLRRLRENPHGTFRYPGDEEDRETSLAATLDLSYELLPGNAQQAFARLALFPAGLTRDAARAILGAASEAALETLAQHSMAEWRDDSGYQRFALPEPARRYAEARQPPDALATYAPPALAFFADLIDAADDAISSGRIVEGRMVLTLEQPNIERFLEWGYDHEDGSSGVSRAARATARMGNYWTLTGEKGRPEIAQRLQCALAAAQRAGDRLGEANVLQAIGDVQQFRKETNAALESYQQALRLYRDVGDRLGEANVLAALSRLRLDDDPAGSQHLLEQALALRRAIGSVYDEAADLGNYGIALLQRGRGAEALPYLERARDLFASRGLAHLVEDMERLIVAARLWHTILRRNPLVRMWERLTRIAKALKGEGG